MVIDDAKEKFGKVSPSGFRVMQADRQTNYKKSLT